MRMFAERIFKVEDIAGPRALQQGTPDVLEDQEEPWVTRVEQARRMGSHLTLVPSADSRACLFLWMRWEPQNGFEQRVIFEQNMIWSLQSFPFTWILVCFDCSHAGLYFPVSRDRTIYIYVIRDRLLLGASVHYMFVDWEFALLVTREFAQGWPLCPNFNLPVVYLPYLS